MQFYVNFHCSIRAQEGTVMTTQTTVSQSQPNISKMLGRTQPTMTIQAWIEREKVAEKPGDRWFSSNVLSFVDSSIEIAQKMLSWLPVVKIQENESAEAFLMRMGIPPSPPEDADRHALHLSLFSAAADNPHIVFYSILPRQIVLWNKKIGTIEMFSVDIDQSPRLKYTTKLVDIPLARMIIIVWNQHLPNWQEVRTFLCDTTQQRNHSWRFSTDPNFNVSLGRLGFMKEMRATYVVVLRDVNQDLKAPIQFQHAQKVAYSAEVFGAHPRLFVPKRIRTHSETFCELASANPTMQEVIRASYQKLSDQTSELTRLMDGDLILSCVYGESDAPVQYVLFIAESMIDDSVFDLSPHGILMNPYL